MKATRDFRVLKNDPSELRPLSRWALEIAHGLGLPSVTCHDIDLCLHEAVSNIIRHGCSESREHLVTVHFEAAPAGIRIQVEDDASPFDPLGVPPPPEARTLESAATSGYGLPLLRALTSQLRYERVDGRNRLTLVFSSSCRS